MNTSHDAPLNPPPARAPISFIHLPPLFLRSVVEMLLPYNHKENAAEGHCLEMLLDCFGWRAAHELREPYSEPIPLPLTPPPTQKIEERIKASSLLAVQVMFNAVHMDGDHVIERNRERVEIFEGHLFRPLSYSSPLTIMKLLCKTTYALVQDLLLPSRAIGMFSYSLSRKKFRPVQKNNEYLDPLPILLKNFPSDRHS